MSDMRTICALLQTSSACRRAVQHATADCAADFTVNELKKLAQFSAWMPHHAGLITSLSIGWYWAGPAPLAGSWPVAEQLISAAVQQSLHASNDVDGKASSVCIRISCLSIPCPASPALFKALAAVSSLTSLNIACAPSQPTAAVCAALGRLHSLRDLQLASQGCSGMVTAKVAVALQQLQQLTALCLAPCMHPDMLQHFPGSVRVLQFRVALVPDAKFGPAHELSQEPPVCIDLHHLTQLTDLRVDTSVPLSGDSVLPKELMKLSAEGPCNLHPGSKLEDLMLNAPQQSLRLMQHLPQLPQLPQLRYLSLQMSEYHGDASEAEIVAVVAAVQHATQVTGLDWNFSGLKLSAEDNAVLATDLGIGSVLAGLTQLLYLYVGLPGIPEAEVLRLTALTSLTELQLFRCGEGVTDMVLVAVACRLRKLHVLELLSCSNLSNAVLPALGSLTTLSRMSLTCWPAMSDEGLQQLTTLTALRHLWVEGLGNAPALSAEGRSGFLAAMPQLSVTCS